MTIDFFIDLLDWHLESLARPLQWKHKEVLLPRKVRGVVVSSQEVCVRGCVHACVSGKFPRQCVNKSWECFV